MTIYEIKVLIDIEGVIPLYDTFGKRYDEKESADLIFNKLKECLKDYIEEKGLDTDFINSDFGVEEAEELDFYGKIKFKVE